MKKYAGVVVRYQNKALLCKRNAKSDLPGHWACPSGGVDNGETYKEAAKREFYEETGKKIKGDVDFVGTVMRYSRDGSELRGKLYIFLYDADIPIYPNLRKASSGHEHSECGYFDKKHLPIPMTSEFRKMLEIILI